MRTQDLRAARVATFAVTGVLVLAMGLYAAVLSGPSQAADSSGESSAGSCASTAAKPRPVWHGTKSLALTPNNPIPRERVRLRGKVAKPVARGTSVRVQVKRSGKSWQTVDKDRSISRKGNWTARFRAPSKKTPLAVRSQVLDPRGRVVSTSKPQHLRMTKLRIKLTVPESVSVNEPWEATIAISPARPGARVTLLMRLKPASGAKVNSRDSLDDWLPVGSTFQTPPVPPASFAFMPVPVGALSAQYPGPFADPSLSFGADFGVDALGYAGIPPFEGDIGSPEDFGLNGTIPEEPTPTETPTPTDEPTPTETPTPTDEPTPTPTEEPTPTPTDEPPPTDGPPPPTDMPMPRRVGCLTG